MKLDEVWNQVKACSGFVESIKPVPNSKGIVTYSMLDIMKYDVELYDYILDKDFDDAYRGLLQFTQIYCKEQFNQEINTINLLPNEKLECKPIAFLTHGLLEKPVRVKGFFVSGSSTYIYEKNWVTCDACKQRFRALKLPKTCIYCRTHIMNEWVKKERVALRELNFQEQYDERQHNETIPMILKIQKNNEETLIDYQDLFGRKHDILAVVRQEKLPSMGSEKGEKYQIVLEIVGILPVEMEQIKPKRIQEIRKLVATTPDIIEKVAKHIAKEIYGYGWVKQALLLTMIGCAPISEDMPKRKLQMATLIISNAGMGKTYMSKRFLDYMPRSIYLTANMSKAGLVGGVEKTPSGTYMFSVGQLPMANNSMVILDEIDNFNREDADVLLTVISEGLLQVNKIKKFEMNIHINFIVQGNPKGSHFDPNSTYFSQIDLTQPFLDRMDFIIILQNPYDEQDESSTKGYATDVLLGKAEPEVEIDDGLVKDYLFYVKNYIPNPRISREVAGYISEKWFNLKVALRSSELSREDSKPMETRALVSLAKLSMTVGRMFFAKNLTNIHVDIAYEIWYNSCIAPMIGVDGKLVHYSIKPKNVCMKRPHNLRTVINFLIDILNKDNREYTWEEFMEKVVEDCALPERLLEEAIEKMKQAGEISEVKRGVYKRLI